MDEGAPEAPSYETPYKPLGRAQKKVLRGKVANRTATRAEAVHLDWDRRFRTDASVVETYSGQKSENGFAQAKRAHGTRTKIKPMPSRTTDDPSLMAKPWKVITYTMLWFTHNWLTNPLTFTRDLRRTPLHVARR